MSYLKRKQLRVIVKIVLWLLAGTVLAMVGVWCAFAVYFSNLPWFWLRAVLAWCLPVGVVASFVLLRKRVRTAIAIFAVYLLIIVWWLMIPASNDRDWLPEYSRLPSFSLHGDLLTVRNIRNFDYRTEKDFTVRYYDKTFDLKKLKTVNFMTVYWDNHQAIAHTMLSFGFSDGRYLCFSVETRREKGEPQSAIRGMFKQYELIYVIGDERDLIRLRTNYRGEQVYLYPTTSTPQEARIVLMDLLRKADSLNEKPKFYNTLTSNCTTTLAPSVRKVRPPRPFDWRLLKNGFSDEMAYQNGWISSGISPFSKMKKLHFINDIAESLPNDAEFSRKLRQKLKERLQNDPAENFL